jgi:S1-C subfamily serine protease
VTFEWLSKQKIVKGARWFFHPKTDIAVHPMAYPEKLELLAIDQNDCPKKDIETPLLTPGYILGFPLGLGVHDTLSAIAKATKIASRATSVDVRGISPDLKFILLDEAVAQGYSGSPVFCTEDILSTIQIGTQRMKAGEKVHFVGIISAVLPDSTGGKITLVVPGSCQAE